MFYMELFKELFIYETKGKEVNILTQILMYVFFFIIEN